MTTVNVLRVPSVYPTVEAAWVDALNGDIIEIEDAATYTLPASLAVPAGESRTVRCVAETRATITSTAACFTLPGAGAALTIENLRLETTADDFIIADTASVTLHAITCEFVPTIWVFSGGGGGYLLTALFERCVFADINDLSEVDTSGSTFESCVFLRVSQVATSGDLSHPSFIDCDATGLGPPVLICANLINPLFVGCATDADNLVTAASISHCHHYNCSAAVAVLPPGAVETSTGDPRLVAAAGVGGVVPLPSSPLVGAGNVANGGVTHDYFGRPFGATPTIGAAETAAIASATADGPDTLHVVFTSPVEPVDAADLTAWTIDGGAAGTVSPFAIVLAAGDTEAFITTWPAPAPGETFTVTYHDLPVPLNAFAATIPAGYVGDEPPQLGLIAAFATAVGRELQELGGRPVAVLVKDFAPGDTIIFFDSTYGFPPAAAVWGGGYHQTYTGKTDGALTGVTSLDRTRTIPRRTTFTLDVEAVEPDDPTKGALSDLDRAWRGTLTHLAEDEDLDSLADIYGIPRPRIVGRGPWRKVLAALAYGPRGLPRGTMHFLIAALDAYHEQLAVELRPDQPTRLYATAGVFEQRHVGRWVLIDERVYKIVGPPDVAADSAGAWVELCDVKSGYTWAANWSLLKETTAATATILCFVYQATTPGPIRDDAPRGTYFGRAANLDVWLWEDRVGEIPPTYLLDDGVDRPAGMPFGGHLLEDATVDGDQVDGPFPIYLWDSQVLTPIEHVLDLLTAAQVSVRFIRKRWAGYVPTAFE